MLAELVLIIKYKEKIHFGFNEKKENNKQSQIF